MKKMNINIDRPEVSSEEISTKRDFSNLLKQYKQIEKTPFYVRYRLPLLSAGVIIGIGALLFTMKEKKVAADPKMNHKLVSAQAAPVEETKVTEEEKSNTVEESKSVLTRKKVKADQPVVSNFNPVVSNDRMKKDTVAATTPVSPSLPKEEVKAKMSKEEATKKIGILEKEISALKIQRRRLDLQKPIKPNMASGKTFNIDVVKNQFPQLVKYNNVEFEAASDAKDFSNDFFKTKWEDGKISQDTDGNYFVTISKGKEKHTFKAIPVFKGEAYNETVKQYEEYVRKTEGLLLQQSEKQAERDELLKIIK